jgi:hypothetical protein
MESGARVLHGAIELDLAPLPEDGRSPVVKQSRGQDHAARAHVLELLELVSESEDQRLASQDLASLHRDSGPATLRRASRLEEAPELAGDP